MDDDVLLAASYCIHTDILCRLTTPSAFPSDTCSSLTCEVPQLREYINPAESPSGICFGLSSRDRKKSIVGTVSAMLSSTLFLFALIPPSLGVRYCPLLGPNFPKPRNLATNEFSRSAAELLSSSVEQALHVGGSAFGNDTLDATSFSTSIFSVHESTPIFEYHHTARLLDVTAGGTTNVTADTVFRIGSVSKLLTVYALLLQGGRIRFDDRISAYIPELMTTDELDEVQNVQWDEVTIEALASHMAGIGRDCEPFSITSALWGSSGELTNGILHSQPCRSCNSELPLDPAWTSSIGCLGGASLCWQRGTATMLKGR